MDWDLCVTLTIGIKRKQKRLNFLHLNFFLHLTCHVNRTNTLLLLILQQKLTSRGVTVFINYLLTEKKYSDKNWKSCFQPRKDQKAFWWVGRAFFATLEKMNSKYAAQKWSQMEKNITSLKLIQLLSILVKHLHSEF